MNEDYNLNRNEEFFSGDIDFNDNFDMDPIKNNANNKFIPSIGTGILTDVTNGSTGSIDGLIRDFKYDLPNPFTTHFDKLNYVSGRINDLRLEFVKNRYESVRDLQNIAKDIYNKISDKNSRISKKLNEVTERDFSEWETLTENELRSDELKEEVFEEQLNISDDKQIESLNNVADGLLQMQAYTSGETIAAIKSGNRELIGVQAAIRDLLDYKRNVQYEMDKTKIELLTRTYLINVKFYKFIETAFHNSIEKFERIAANTKLTDFQKSSLLGKLRANASNKFFSSLTSGITEKADSDSGFSSEKLVGKIQGGQVNTIIDNVIKALSENKTLIYSTLGAAALNNPRSAKTIGVGLGLGGAYAGLGYIARGDEPRDDENILDSTGSVLLYSAKLRMGVYQDTVSKQPLKSWKDIKGAVYDTEDDTYITFAQLTDKIYGQDGRLLIIKGLNKTRDNLNELWNKIDLTGNFTNLLDRAKSLFYQQDVYVRGDKTPRLTKKGFIDNKYYCFNTDAKTPYLITGWNEIKGPVYEMDEDGTLNQIISEAEIANGLVTSSGISLDKLTKMTSWAGVKHFKGLDKSKLLKEKSNDKLNNKESNENDRSYNFSVEGVEERLDKIYDLLCQRFSLATGINIRTNEYVTEKPNLKTPVETTVKQKSSPISDIIEKYKNRNTTVHEPIEPEETPYPNKIRLNSLADKKLKQEKKQKDRFYDDIHAIRQDMDGSGKKGVKEKSKGLFGKLTGLLTSGVGILAKLFTNPLGLVGSLGMALGGAFIKSLFKSSKRLVTLGSLLFKGVLGISSPVYKLLSWGFTGLMQAMRGSAIKDALGGRSVGKGKGRGKIKTKAPRSSKFKVPKFGKFGKLATLGALAAGAFYSSKSSANDELPEENENYDNSNGFDYESDNDAPVDENGHSSIGEDQYGYNGNGLLTAGAGIGAQYAASKAVDATTSKISGKMAERAAAKATEKAGAEAASKVGVKAASKVLGKGAARFVPGLNLVLGAYDGISGFTNRDQLEEVYHKDAFTGKEKLANAATEVLGLGGLVPMAMNGLADLTGIDSLKQEGGMTKFIEKGLNFWSKIPGLNAPLLALSLFDDENSNKPKTAQVKIRMVMYGLNDLDNSLAMSIFTAEKMLEKFVVFESNKGYVRIDDKAPFKDILNLFDDANPTELGVWFRDRFLKVYCVWQSAIRIVGYNNLNEFDDSKEPKVIKVCNQVKGAIGSLSPYPLDIVTHIDPKIPLIGREQAQGLISTYLKELRDSIGKGSNTAQADGIIPMDNLIRTDTEVREGKSNKDAGFFTKVKDYINEVGVGLDDSIYKPSADVVNIDISDLHKDQNTAIDEITLVRLAAYGNTDNDSIRVDTVLKLERHCEKLFLFQGGNGKFIGKIGDIYSLFKNSFRVNSVWEDNWINWFNNRFLPVLKVWFEQVFTLRNAPPYRAWKSLTATNKFIIAQTILDIKVKTDGTNDLTSVWDITEAPFPNMKSGSDSTIVKTFIANLESKSAAAKLKMPEDEAAKSNAIDMSNSTSNLTLEQQQEIISKASGGINIGGYNNAPNTPTTMANYNNQAIGAGASESGMFSSENQGDISGGGTDYTPSSTQTEKGFQISEKEAIKTILNEFVKAGITDNRVLAFGLANAKAETNFQGSAESLNYSADRLPGIFSSTFGKNPNLAYKYGRTINKPADQKAIANIAYGRKYGNQGGEDGWEYRGRGYTQLTFKDNYKAVGQQIGDPSIVNNPEKLTTDPVTAAKSAVGFFKAHPEIMANVKSGNIAAAAKVVGQHVEGINKKVSYYPDFLKRLTQGDLKSILSNEENKEENKEESNENEVPQFSPIPKAEQITAPIGSPQDAVEKVNAPPAVDNISQSAPDLTEAAKPDVVETPSAPEPVQTQPAVVPSAPVTPAPEPVQNNIRPAAKEQPLLPSEVKLPEGVIKVQDEAVASAIVALAEAISKSVNSSSSPGKRVGLGQRI